MHLLSKRLDRRSMLTGLTSGMLGLAVAKNPPKWTHNLDLEDQAVVSAPTQISWTRIGPWLPWMKMADRPGNLVYHCTGHKVNHGFDGLPVHLREFVNTHHSRYRTAPESFTRPNETSWTYFKKILERGGTE